MEWISNANTIVGLIVGLIGICGTIFTIVGYLKKKASPVVEVEVANTTETTRVMIHRSLTWIQWTDLFAQAAVDTAKFLLNFFHVLSEFRIERETPSTLLGSCLLISSGIFFGTEFILATIIGIFFGILGLNSVAIAVLVPMFLFSVAFSIVYLYHVGLILQNKQIEAYYESLQEQTMQ